MIFISNTLVENSQNFVFKLISAHLVDQNSYTHTHTMSVTLINSRKHLQCLLLFSKKED